MFLKVLVDNNTIIDDYALGEPALAFYLEVDNKKILFDTGYSNILINNAKHYQISLDDLDYIVLSHGHNDHSRGLKFLLENVNLAKTTLIAHPEVFEPKKDDKELDIGNPLKLEEVMAKMKVVLTTKPYQITNNLYFLGEIPSRNDFENQEAIGKKLMNGEWVADYLVDDSALAFIDNEEVMIITGCSHRGIVNICEQAKAITNKRITSIIGGFHLFEDNYQLEKTIDYFKKETIKELYPCHCVSFLAKAKLNNEIPITEVGVGFEIVK